MKRNKKSISIVHLLKWQGLYVNGRLVAEGTKITARHLICALKLNVHYHWLTNFKVQEVLYKK